MEASERPSVRYLGKGLVWVCCPLDAQKCPFEQDVESLAASIVAVVASGEAKHPCAASGDILRVSAADVRTALLSCNAEVPGSSLNGTGGKGGGATCSARALVPEAMEELNFCTWDGDGHFDMMAFGRHDGLPTLGQIVRFLHMVDASAAGAPRLTLHISSPQRRNAGAVLAGAALVLTRGKKANQAWEELLRSCPRPHASPALAWDRFPLPFGRGGATTCDSLRVVDCLQGLQVAMDLGWFPSDFRKFDLEEWSLLRKKLDMTWLIPGELLAMANPGVVSRNPNYPGLLGADCQKKEETDLESTDAPSEEDDMCCSRKSSEKVFPDSPTSASPAEEGHPIFFKMGDRPDLSEVALVKQDTFITYLQRKEVSMISRLNEPFEVPEQDEYLEAFSEAGFELPSFEFPDGEVPNKKLVDDFLRWSQECQKKQSPVAVHCKAGLGRTGVLVAAYATAQHNVDGKAFHGWVRLCRPGSVQSPAQERFVRGLNPRGQRAATKATRPWYLAAFCCTSTVDDSQTIVFPAKKT